MPAPGPSPKVQPAALAVRSVAVALLLLAAWPADLRAGLPVQDPGWLPFRPDCDASFVVEPRTLDGPDAVTLPVVEFAVTCPHAPGSDVRQPVLVVDACVYGADGRHLRPVPTIERRRPLPEGSRLAACLPAGGLWSTLGTYPQAHRGHVLLAPGEDLVPSGRRAWTLRNGEIDPDLASVFVPLEHAWRAHFGGEPGLPPEPLLVRGVPLPSWLVRWARAPRADAVRHAMYQAAGGTWLGWTGPLVVGVARLGSTACRIESDGERWSLRACQGGLPQGTTRLGLDLFDVIDPDPSAVFGLDGPERGISAALPGEGGAPLVSVVGLVADVEGDAPGTQAAPPPPAGIALRPVPLLAELELAAIGLAGGLLVVGGLGLVALGRRRRRAARARLEAGRKTRRMAGPVAPEGGPAARAANPPEPAEGATPAPRETPPPTPGMPAPLLREPPPPPPPQAAPARSRPARPAPPPPAPPMVGGRRQPRHAIRSVLESPPALRAVQEAAGLHPDLSTVELLPESGGFQASYLVSDETSWRQSVVSIYPHEARGARDERYLRALRSLVEAEVSFWRRAPAIAALLASGIPDPASEEEGGGEEPFAGTARSGSGSSLGLQPELLAVPPDAWAEQVRPVAVELPEGGFHGLLRPYVPWPTLADQVVPKDAVRTALASLLAAVEESGFAGVVPLVDLERDIEKDDPKDSGTLRTWQLLLALAPSGRTIVLPTQWRPLLARQRAAFAWEGRP